jgi:DNA-binding NarL/FixJ family response regulator
MARTRWPDVLLAGFVTAGIVAEIVAAYTPTPRQAVAAVASIAMGASIAWRRVAPVPIACAGAVGMAAAALLGPHVETVSLSIAFFVISYSAVAYSRDRRTALLSGTLLMAGVSAYSWALFPGLLNLGIAWLQAGVAFGIGALMRRLRLTAVTSEQRAARAEEVREQHAAEAVAAERARIARDLHDVVAHAISVIVLQARGGRRMLTIDPAESRSAFDAIEHLGADALTDMRHMLGLIRTDGDAELTPQPSLRHRGLPHRPGVADERPAACLGDHRLRERTGRTGRAPHRGVRRRQRPGGRRAGIRHPRHAGKGRHVRRHGRSGPPVGRRIPGAGVPARVAMIRVLLADDQRLVRAGFRMILRAEPDIEVAGEAADGVEAVEAARRLRPDVVLMDIRMPRLDGIEATRLLLQQPDPPRVLVVTTFDLDQYVYDALRLGAGGFLLKDAPEDQLIAAIRTVDKGVALLDRDVTRRLIDAFAGRAAAARGPAELKVLTSREIEVLRLLAQGRSNAEIARDLHVSDATVKTHVAHVLAKLGLASRTQAVVLAYETRLVTPGAGT